MEKAYIFLDEFGDSSLNVEKIGTTSQFIYSFVLINGDELENARKIREEISKKYFQSADIKASHIGNDEKGKQKRISILNKLNELKYFIWTFVIDKKEIEKNKGGLRFKEIFIKYFQKNLIKTISKSIFEGIIYFDQLGYIEFQKSLEDFINKKVLNRDLFDKIEYCIKTTKMKNYCN